MTEIIDKKQSLIISKSSILLIIVLLTTIALYFYNSNLENKIQKTKLTITSIENNIKEVNNNDKIKIYSLLELNKEYIKSLKKMSYITKYINHMKDIESKYDITFSGFSMNKGAVKTDVTIISDGKGIAYQKTRDFIKKYRKDETALFDLGFIGSIAGMDNIGFSTELKIK